MLSQENSKVKTIIISRKLSKWTEDENVNIVKYLQQLPDDCTLLDKMDLSDGVLTDDTFIPISNVIKSVKDINLRGNNLTSKSLYSIIKVGFYLYLYTLRSENISKKQGRGAVYSGP